MQFEIDDEVYVTNKNANRARDGACAPARENYENAWGCNIMEENGQ